MARHKAERPGGRLARSYLAVRAEQVGEAQPVGRRDALKGVVVLPRLDLVQLNSPEAHAQHRLVMLARLATSGDAWFTLAGRD